MYVFDFFICNSQLLGLKDSGMWNVVSRALCGANLAVLQLIAGMYTPYSRHIQFISLA